MKFLNKNFVRFIFANSFGYVLPAVVAYFSIILTLMFFATPFMMQAVGKIAAGWIVLSMLGFFVGYFALSRWGFLWILGKIYKDEAPIAYWRWKVM